MADLITMMTRDQEEIQKVCEVARNASQMKASAEFVQATKEFFGTIKPDGKPSYHVTYVNNRWAPLVSLLKDPEVRRFLHHVIVDRYFSMVPRDAAVSLLRDLDPRYGNELAPELEGLRARVSKKRPVRLHLSQITDRNLGNLGSNHSDSAC
jgi:hypothetical protein